MPLAEVQLMSPGSAAVALPVRTPVHPEEEAGPGAGSPAPYEVVRQSCGAEVQGQPGYLGLERCTSLIGCQVSLCSG